MLRRARDQGRIRALLRPKRRVGYRLVIFLQTCTMMWHRQHSTCRHRTRDSLRRKSWWSPESHPRYHCYHCYRCSQIWLLLMTQRSYQSSLRTNPTSLMMMNVRHHSTPHHLFSFQDSLEGLYRSVHSVAHGAVLGLAHGVRQLLGSGA